MRNNLFNLFKTFRRMRSFSYLLQRTIELVLGYPMYWLSFLIPRNSQKWVFGTNVGFIDNAKYLFIYTQEQTDKIRPIWISSSDADIKKVYSIGGEAYKKYSIKGLFHSLTASIYIFTYHSKDINFFTSGNAKKINLWHGIGIKGGNGGRKSNNFASKQNTNVLTRILLPHLYEKNTLFLSTSDMMNKHFMNMFSMTEETIFDAIYPRCYFMCKEMPLILDFISKYEDEEMMTFIQKLSHFDKIFLYMPTWRGNLNDDFIEEAGFNFNELNRILQSRNRIFIFKLHPAIRLLKHTDTGSFSNIIFLNKKLDIYPILPFVDVLITDYSSIYYDFCLLDKEIILYPFDKEEFVNNSNDLAFNYDEFTPGMRVYNITQLLQAVASDENYQIKDRTRIIKEFWGKCDPADLAPLYKKIQSL